MKPQWTKLPGGWQPAYEVLSKAWDNERFLQGTWEIRVGYERTMARLEMRRVKSKGKAK